MNNIFFPHRFSHIKLPLLIAVVIISFSSCNKLLDAEHKYIFTPNLIFSNNDSANYALSGLYASMGDANSATQSPFCVNMPINPSLSSDELITPSNAYTAIYRYSLDPNSLDQITNKYWAALYSYIYQCNSIIEGISNSTGMTSPYKEQYMGEALFWRAYYYFYLVNFYGAVPLITTTDYKTSSKLGRTAVDELYKQITTDLQQADLLMSDNINANEVFRVNKSAVEALLARVSLFTSNWADAEKYASAVINSGKYSLATIDKVFYDESPETIFAIHSQFGVSIVATESLPTENYIYAVNDSFSNNLIQAYGTTDLRGKNYITQNIKPENSTATYYIPYKYKINGDDISADDGHTESTVYLRLGEQYLIRAEARARLNKLSEAVADINMIRTRAGVTPITVSGTADNIVSKVIDERRLEMCFEWADRWFTLKRTNTVNAVMSAAKPAYWKSTAVLYPIPFLERQKNPALTQNEGY